MTDKPAKPSDLSGDGEKPMKTYHDINGADKFIIDPDGRIIRRVGWRPLKSVEKPGAHAGSMRVAP